MMRTFALCLPLLLAFAACSPAASDASTSRNAAPTAEVHLESGLRVIPLTVRSEGAVHEFRVEVAESPYEQAKGLMFRTRLGPNEGMIFPMKPPRAASFWMRNTVIPLDMVFIGKDRRILNIAAQTTPYSEEPRKSQGVAVAVLELPGGRAAELGIRPGDSVAW